MDSTYYRYLGTCQKVKTPFNKETHRNILNVEKNSKPTMQFRHLKNIFFVNSVYIQEL